MVTIGLHFTLKGRLDNISAALSYWWYFMKQRWFILIISTILALLTPQISYAASCSVEGDRDFTVQWRSRMFSMNLWNPPVLQLGLADDSKPIETLWRQATRNNGALFFETFSGWTTFRSINRIEFSASKQTLTYSYKKNGSNDWHGGAVHQINLPSSTLHINDESSVANFIEGWFNYITELSCEQESSFVPPLPEPIDYCAYFPEPAQSWSNSSRLEFEKAEDGAITGWSDDYVDSYLVEQDKKALLSIGFNTVIHDKDKNRSCEHGMCAFGGKVIRQPAAITPYYGNLSLQMNFDDDEVDGLHPKYVCDRNENYCAYDQSNQTITIKKSLSQLLINLEKRDDVTVKFDSADGRPLYIGSYQVIRNDANGLAHYFAQDNQYFFGDLITEGDKGDEFITDSSVVLNIEKNWLHQGEVSFVDAGGKGDFVIYAPSATVNIQGLKNQQLNTHILANSLNIEGNGHGVSIEGAVSSNDLILGQHITISGKSHCVNAPTERSYFIRAVEPKQVALTCEIPTVKFEVINEEGTPSQLPIGEQIHIDVSGLESSSLELIKGSRGSSDQHFYPSINGELWFEVEHDVAQGVTVSATLEQAQNAEEAQVATNEILFSPYAIRAEQLNVIAGRPSVVKAKVLACNSDDSPVEVSYQGTPKINVTLIEPVEGSVGDVDYSPSFEKGISQSELTLSEVGQFSIHMEDNRFNCTDYDANCPIDGGVLQGQFTVNAKPWQLELCDSSKGRVDGTAHSGNGFIAAGESFKLQVTPIAYSDNYQACQSSQITENYWKPVSGFPHAKLVLAHKLHTPQQGNLGLLQAPKGLEYALTSVAKQLVTDLSYDEVGSITLTATGSASFYEQFMVDGQQGVNGEAVFGRFYPSYLAIDDNDWDYAIGFNEFAYMGQDIAHTFAVSAYNSNQQKVVNYHLFDGKYVSNLSYFAKNSDGSSLDNRVNAKLLSDTLTRNGSDLNWGGSDWTNESLQVEFETFTLDRKVKSITRSGIISTEPDGPFNTKTAEFGLMVDNIVDDVQFRDLNNQPSMASAFLFQPDWRYGRIYMKTTGGISGSELSLPVYIESWVGDRFQKEMDDNGSQINGSNFCQLHNWRNSSAIDDTNLMLKIQGVSKASSGELSGLKAAQPLSHSEAREQVKIWLRLGSTNESNYHAEGCQGQADNLPWLSYNWSDKGDEDPHTVITFGVASSNNRVIYRGESGFLGSQIK